MGNIRLVTNRKYHKLEKRRIYVLVFGNSNAETFLHLLCILAICIIASENS